MVPGTACSSVDHPGSGSACAGILAAPSRCPARDGLARAFARHRAMVVARAPRSGHLDLVIVGQRQAGIAAPSSACVSRTCRFRIELRRLGAAVATAHSGGMARASQRGEPPASTRGSRVRRRTDAAGCSIFGMESAELGPRSRAAEYDLSGLTPSGSFGSLGDRRTQVSAAKSLGRPAARPRDSLVRARVLRVTARAPARTETRSSARAELRQLGLVFAQLAEIVAADARGPGPRSTPPRATSVGGG